MKKRLLTELAIGMLVLCIAGIANAEIYGGVEFPNGYASFADEVISYNPTAAVVGGGHDDPSKALGSPDYTTGQNYVSLGIAGDLTLKFSDNYLTASGDNSYDLCIFEVGEDQEPFSVAISTDGVNWIDVGIASGGISKIDIDAYTDVVSGEKYSYVKLKDSLLTGDYDSPYACADIDAVGAISSVSTVPIPGAVWLLGTGLAGLAGIRARRRKYSEK